MGIKEYLNNLISDKEKKVNELRAAIEASEDVNEVRSLGDALNGIKSEIEEARNQLKAMEEETRFNALGTYGVKQEKREEEVTDRTNTIEYRKAFMALVTKGTPIPAELREDANTKTTDVASVIPTIIINRIVEGMTVCGMILPLVTKTAFAGGVVVPTSAVKPVASWVAEGASSDRQKKTTGSVTFAYYKLRCEISMSAEVGAMALSVFETTFVQNVVDAMVVEREKAILAGNGTGKPTGILNGTIPAGQIVTTTGTSGAVTYADLLAMEGTLPQEYDATAVYFCTKADFYNEILAAVDDNGQPVARINMGIDGRPERTLFGRPVIIHPYATEMGDNILGLYDFRDYVENTIYDLGIERQRDWDTEDLLTKAVMSVDGKPVSRASLVVMQKGA